MNAEDPDVRVLQHIDQTFRDQIRQADQKASIVIAFVAGLFTLNRDAVGPAGQIVAGWMQLRATLAVLLFAALFVSMAAAFYTVAPRIDKGVASILFWQNWRSKAGVAAMERRLAEPGFVRGELILDIQVLARLIHRKLVCLRWALGALYLALTLFGLLIAMKALFA